MLMRGRCRRCGAPIDPFHGRVELASGLIGTGALALMPGVTVWLWALFGWLLLPLALLDARHFWLPDRLSALLAIAGLLGRTSVVSGTSVSLRLDFGGRRVIKKNNH